MGLWIVQIGLLIFAGVTIVLLVGNIRRPTREPVDTRMPTLDVQNRSRGRKGQAAVHQILVDDLSAAAYFSYDTVLLPRVGGERAASIDHVVVSAFGVFVIRSHRWPGLISGRPEHEQWTHKLGRKIHKPDNPMVHTKRLANSTAKYLDISPKYVHPIVCFSAPSSRFSYQMPNNVVLLPDLIPRIKNFNERVLNDDGVRRVSQLVAELA